jgi:hypothetical protein
MKYKKIGAIIFLLGLTISGFYAEAQTTSTATSTPPLAPMAGYCTTSIFPGSPGEYNVQWTVVAVPSANAVYSWSGAASSTTNLSTVSNRFDTSGRKTANVNVRSGELSMDLSCSADFSIPNLSTSTISQYHPIGGRCEVSTSGLTVFWSGYSTGAQGETIYNWSGDSLATTTSDATKIFQVTYPTEGVKNAQVEMRADGQTITLSCQAKVASTTSSGCFIATAAFGTEMEPEVVTLRKFRDEKLLTNKIGEKFVKEYYKVSPPIANYIRDKEYLRAIVRAGLKPVIYLLDSK